MKRKRFITTSVLAWIVFIGIDFLFHASILKAFWNEEVEAFKPAQELFLLIPAGYLSFLLLTLLVGYLFTKSYKNKPGFRSAMKFGIIFGLLFSLSNFFAVFSFINIPLTHLLLFNIVYFIEINAVVYIFYKSMLATEIRKLVWSSLFYFFAMLIAGIIIQNLA